MYLHLPRYKNTFFIYKERFRRICVTFIATFFDESLPVDQFCLPLATNFPKHPVVRVFEVKDMVAMINRK